MSYARVIPRDLFNESKLLKCLGRLCILAESHPTLEIEHDGHAFTIAQEDWDGSIYVSNVFVLVKGCQIWCRTTLNARDAWPMFASLQDDSEVSVFTDSGDLTPEFLALL